jgi:uncharacterized membrane protein YeaQ/YmgE (transglycosylase-associated protein family)
MTNFADIVLDPWGIIMWAVVGIIAGWLAGLVMRGGGYGILGDLIVGLVGALLGGFLFSLLGLGFGGLLGSIFVAFIGACILIAVVRFFTRGRTSL